MSLINFQNLLDKLVADQAILLKLIGEDTVQLCYQLANSRPLAGWMEVAKQCHVVCSRDRNRKLGVLIV
jgi:hypothetical protein